jgi:hypothetical protein
MISNPDTMEAEKRLELPSKVRTRETTSSLK